MIDDQRQVDVEAWLDGEVPPSEARRIRLAVEQDRGLGKEAESLRVLDDLLGMHPRIAPSPDFTERVVHEVGRVRRGSPFSRISPWRAAAAAAIIVAAFFSWRGLVGGTYGGNTATGEEAPLTLADWAVVVPENPVSEADRDLERAWREIVWIEESYLPTG